jgi:hypothetical protein
MDHTLTVGDLLQPGEPLDSAQVKAGEAHLTNPVSWVVSLRPYPPAFPRLRGGELALVAAEHLARLEPPTTLADVVRYLAMREAAGVAVRGEVDAQAVEAAHLHAIPLLQMPADAPLHDIEQAIMRECALYQARREMLPMEAPTAWVEDLLAGRFNSTAEAQAAARKRGYVLADTCSVAFLIHAQGPAGGAAGLAEAAQKLEVQVGQSTRRAGPAIVLCPVDEGLAALLPPGTQQVLMAALSGQTGCGIGTEKPLIEAHRSLEEAKLAAIASAYLNNCAPTRYTDMGADRLLVLLYRHHRDELEAFVEDTLGPLLRHDERSATPLLPTLRAFVEHGGRLRETAEAIFVHRNTLAYRLDRAAEILGADLKDPCARLAIELALRAMLLVLVRESRRKP